MYTQLTINGGVYDHSSVRILFTGPIPLPPTIQNFIKEINYDHRMEGATQEYGGQVTPLGSTYGVYRATLSFTILREGLDLFTALLPVGYTGFYFDLSITMLNPIGPTAVDRLTRCRLTGESISSAQGGRAIECKIDCMVDGILIKNGNSLVNFIDQDASREALTNIP